MVVGMFNSIGSWLGFGPRHLEAFFFKKIDGEYAQQGDEVCRVEFTGEEGERRIIICDRSEEINETFILRKLKRIETFSDNNDQGACFGFGVRRNLKFIVHFGLKFKNEGLRDEFVRLLDEHMKAETIEEEEIIMEEEGAAVEVIDVEAEIPAKRSPVNSAKKKSKSKSKKKSTKKKSKKKTEAAKKKTKKTKKKGAVKRAKRAGKKAARR